MWICQCWLIQLTWLELIINYDTHDYNVIFNDMVLIKWEKNHVLILRTSLQKKMTKDMVIMISIIIHNYSNKEIIYKGEILRK